MSAPRTWSSIAATACGLAAAALLLGLSAGARAQDTVVLGRAAEDGPTLPTYSMPMNCSANVGAQNCQVHIATDAALTKTVSKDGPRTEWGLRKDTTYYVQVQSFVFMNGSMRWGTPSPVVKYKYVAPPKLAVPPNTKELIAGLVASHDCNGTKGSMLLPAGSMRPGDVLRSPNKRYELWYQTDGNLVVYEMTPTKKPIWASGKMHNNPAFLKVLTEGNITVTHLESGPDKNPMQVVVWETKTSGHHNTGLVLQDDGNLVVYDEKEPCKSYWASK